MRFITDKPVHSQLILIPLGIIFFGFIILVASQAITYSRFENLAYRLSTNDLSTLNKLSYISVEMGELQKMSRSILIKAEAEMSEAGVYEEAQGVLDRIRALRSEVAEYSFQYSIYSEGATITPSQLKSQLLDAINLFLSRHTSAFTMVTVDLALAESKLRQAEDNYRDAIYVIEKYSENVTKQVSLQFYAENQNVKRETIIIIIVVLVVTIIVLMLLFKYVSKIAGQASAVYKALEELAENPEADIPDKGLNGEMNRIIGSLQKYSHTQRSLKKALDELTEIKENLEQKVADRTSKLVIYENIVQNTDDAIYVLNDSAEFVKVNRAFQEITGFSAADVMGKHIDIMRSGVHDDGFYDSIGISVAKNGKWSGEIWDKRKDGTIYPQITTINMVKDKDTGQVYQIGIFHDITQLKEAEKKLENMAYYDSLTGIANRVTFHDHLDKEVSYSERYNEKFAVLYLDLDGFKSVNDTMGHSAGDIVLQTVAERLRSSIRESDLCCRMGGDEFTAILKKVEDKECISTIAEKIIETVSAPIETEYGTAMVGVSIGVAVYPENGTDSDTIITSADDAMYDAKMAGKGCVKFASDQT